MWASVDFGPSLLWRPRRHTRLGREHLLTTSITPTLQDNQEVAMAVSGCFRARSACRNLCRRQLVCSHEDLVVIIPTPKTRPSRALSSLVFNSSTSCYSHASSSTCLRRTTWYRSELNSKRAIRYLAELFISQCWPAPKPAH